MTATEAPEANQEPPKPVRRDFLTRITPERSRHMRVLAQAARERKKREAEEAAKAAKEAALNPPKPEPAPRDEYLSQRLKRIRAQLDKLDRMIAEETDPQKIDRLASAQAKLATQERETADRPLPGSRRPAPERVQARGSSLIQSLPAPPRTPQGS